MAIRDLAVIQKIHVVRNGVEFCDRNMQLGSACPSDTMDYFENIPFNKVYHEGNTGGDISISQHRCAEVLVQSPLPLRECVQWIYCLSKAERETLLHFLGRSASRWERLVKVSEDLKVFQRQYVFVEEVSISNDGISFRLNPRLDRKNVEISIEILNAKGVLRSSLSPLRHACSSSFTGRKMDNEASVFEWTVSRENYARRTVGF